MISNEEHVALVEKVHAYDYYLDLFNKVRQYYIDRQMSMYTPYFWNDFWLALPDHPAIHRAPFYEICDLAERIYDEA